MHTMRLETTFAVVVTILITASIFILGERFSVPQTPVASAKEKISEPCDKPAEEYLQRAHNALNDFSNFAIVHQQTAAATEATALIEYYKICSERQRTRGAKPTE